MKRSLLWFLVVGTAAALTHLAVFACVQRHMRPELANAVGFGVAFGVSFLGHRWLSFRGTSTPVGQSLGRFALTAAAGFAMNESVFVLLLRVWVLPAGWALALALVAAAGQTYVLGRWWAFRH